MQLFAFWTSEGLRVFPLGQLDLSYASNQLEIAASTRQMGTLEGHLTVRADHAPPAPSLNDQLSAFYDVCNLHLKHSLHAHLGSNIYAFTALLPARSHP